MLTCIYHPLDHFRVVEQDEAERLISSGVWFDCPVKAKNYKKKVEEDLKKQASVNQEKEEKTKTSQSKDKPKEKSNER